MITVRGLFQNHRTYMSRIQVLKYLLEHTDKRISDDTLIEMAIYHKPEIPCSPGNGGSNTEYAALTLEDRRKEVESETQRRSSEWMQELQRLNLYANLYSAAQGALTEEERTLVGLYYERGYTIEEIAQLPLSPRAGGLKSKSTLRRMLRTIEEKIQIVININS